MRSVYRRFSVRYALYPALALLLVAAQCPSDGGTGVVCTVNSVTVTPGSTAIGVGTSTTLTASVNSSNCSPAPDVTWSSGSANLSITGSGPSVTVNGLVASGTPVIVTATANGVSGTSQVTVQPAPAIGLSATALTYNATAGGANPLSQGITITNSGGGTLSGLVAGTIVYGAGATGWLQTPSFSATTASPSATMTLQPVTGALAPGTYAATVPVQSSIASNSPQNVTVTFIVAAAPTITLSSSSLTFNATQGGANPTSQAVTVTNGGGGTLSGLSIGTVTYGAGATGWLQAPVLSGTTANPSVTVTAQPVTGSLAPGTYTATIPVQSTVAANSPQNISVSFTVAPGTPTIVLTPTARTFNAVAGGADPASQTVVITNGGGGTLNNLVVGTVTYGAGATGWLQTPTLSGTTASPSVTLTLQPTTGSLAAGSYTATVPVQSSAATNSPQNVTVTFIVATNAPAIALGPASLTFGAGVGGANPASQFTNITNSGTGTLSGLAVGTITYGAGATGWLQAPVLSGTTAPATLTVQPVTGALAAGTYTATIPVTSGVASNSPQNLTVTFTVSASPIINLNPTSLTFTGAVGRPNPASLFSAISNTGPGTLSGLSSGTITYGAGATGWLNAPVLSGTTAPATLTVQPVTGALAAGTYTANIPVMSGVAANSPQLLGITFTVNPDPCVFANGRPIALGQTINATLAAATACVEPSGHFDDFYLLTLAAPTGVQIDLMAAHDAYLLLVDPATGTVIEEDDDDGDGLNSRINRTLAAGQYLLVATTFSSGVTGPYSIGVIQLVGNNRVFINAGNSQVVLPNTAVPIVPSVIVRDVNGLPVAGVPITFANVAGVGSITGASTTTGVDGIATLGSWTVAAGANVLSATASGGTFDGNPAVFSATGRTAPAGFDVDLLFLTMPTGPQLQAFNNAATRWETIVTSDLAPIDFTPATPADLCANPSPPISGIVDDVMIQVLLGPIDGPGAVLGSAGPCLIRNVGTLPVVGVMQFDAADLAMLEAGGQLDMVILHEMGHVFGIGSLWRHASFNLIVNPSLPSSPGVDTRFIGVNGIAGFDAIGGTTYTQGGKVPVENTQGGQGTRDSHWREGVLANELMTGFLNAGANPLSQLTVRSLEDMGYTVNVAAADPFFLTLTQLAEGAQPGGLRLLNDVRTGPVYRVDAQGRVSDARGRPVAPQQQLRPSKPARRSWVRGR